MKLYDLHVHTSGVSKCSRLSPKQLCEAMKADGNDGFALTNHYSPRHVDLPFPEWLKKYKDEFLFTKELARGYGLKVLFGIEVTLDEPRDFLLYGVTPDCLFESVGRPFWDYSLPELHDFARAHGALLIHAHPYRNGSVPANADDIDGVEVNCHPLYKTNRKEDILAYAAKHGLLVTCGSDYHGDVYKAHCGVWLPDDLENEAEFAAYLKSGQPELLIHDIDVERMRATVIH